MDATPAEIARALTPLQRAEIRHLSDRGFRRPLNAGRARQMALGTSPFGGAHGVPGPLYFLVQKNTAVRGLYRLSELGAAVREALIEQEARK